MSAHSLARFGKLLAVIIAFIVIGFLGISYWLGLSYSDDRAQLAGNHPIAAESASSSGNLDANWRLEMQIRFALRHRAALEKLLADQQNSTSANYHKWLKTGEFSERFGPSKSEIRGVIDWLRSEGFEVMLVAPGYLQFSGSVDQVQRTFAVRIARFGSAGAYANTTDPFVPNRFASVIGAVIGMDNMTRATPISQRTNEAFVPYDTIGSTQAFGPNDFHSFYDENAGPGRDGNGDCIAIVGTSDFLDSAMSAFTDQFGLAPIGYTRELHGANPGINGAEVEAELDLQWAHAAAPGASIVFHLGGYLVDDITGAVNDNQCGAITISYGFCAPSAAFITGVIHPLFQQAALQGQSVFVSSGDQGAAGLGYDPATNACVVNIAPSVNEMSADPDVTSVGGTQFDPKFAGGADQGYAIERAWNDPSGAGGGGASQVFAKPSYQSGAGIPNDGARDVPDVAMMASPNSPGAFFGHDISGTGQVVCCIGGTSLSAPLWAGFSRVLAEVAGQTRLGNFNAIIYELANQDYASAGFHDVTTGNNGFNGLPGFNAAPGYDEATGWGTIDFDLFADAANSLLNPKASPSPTPTPTGGALSVPSKLSFPATATGKPGSVRTLVIRNTSPTSSMSLEVGSLASPFTASGAGHYTVAPASSIPITILLSPATVGAVTQYLQLMSGDPKHPKAMVEVSALVRGGKLSIPSKIALAAHLNGIATRTVTLKNSGAGTLTGTVQAFDADSPFILLGGPVSLWLNPGQVQTVTIQFKPAFSGMASAALVVATLEPSAIRRVDVTGSTK